MIKSPPAPLWRTNTTGALTTVGILPNQKVDIITILASILNLGNVVFDENEMTEEAQVRDMGLAFQTAELLSVDCGMLVQALSKRVTVMRGETITKTLTAVQASQAHTKQARRWSIPPPPGAGAPARPGGRAGGAGVG